MVGGHLIDVRAFAKQAYILGDQAASNSEEPRLPSTPLQPDVIMDGPPTTSTTFTLYVWPGKWGLPSFDPICLAAVLYFQLALPGQFSISECNNPDISPSGQLPFLVHDQFTVASFPAIVKYIAGLKIGSQPDLDASLTPFEKSQKNAWISHIQSHFGDLVYHTYYSSPTNWEKVVHPALVEMYGLPQRYYVPGRIRASYKPRLENAGLWTPTPPELEKKPLGAKKIEETMDGAKKTFNQAFEREKNQDKAREILGIYARLLEGKQFVYQGRPSTLDLILAAHTLLLIAPPLPDTSMKELVEEWYDTLADHAKRIRTIVFDDGKPKYSVHSSHGSIWDLIPSRRTIRMSHPKSSERSPEDGEYEKLTWGFIGLALGSVAAYFAIMGSPIRIVVQRLEEVEEEDGDDDGGEVAEEHDHLEELADLDDE